MFKTQGQVPAYSVGICMGRKLELESEIGICSKGVCVARAAFWNMTFLSLFQSTFLQLQDFLLGTVGLW